MPSMSEVFGANYHPFKAVCALTELDDYAEVCPTCGEAPEDCECEEEKE